MHTDLYQPYVSTYDLAFEFINRAYEEEPSKEIKAKVIRDMTSAVDSGWTKELIMYRFDKEVLDESIKLREFFSPSLINKLKSHQRNVLVSSNRSIYYHNELRVMPRGAEVIWDIDAGVITPQKQEFYLEMRSSITIEQIMDYYLSKFGIRKADIVLNRYLVTLSSMVSQHGADLVLFMIDLMANAVFADGLKVPNSPISLTDYMSEAKVAIQSKQSCIATVGYGSFGVFDQEPVEVGVDKIVYKQRTYAYRGRSQDIKRVC